MDQFYAKILLLEEKNSTEHAKLQVLDFLLGLTGSEDGANNLYDMANTIVPLLLDMTFHSNEDVAKNAIQVLLNISAGSKGAQILLSTALKHRADDIVNALQDHVRAENSSVTKYAIMVMVNLSQNENMARKIYESLKTEEAIEAICSLAVETDCKYDYLSSLLANLTQLAEVRGILLKPSNHGILDKLLTLTGFEDSVTRRYGAVSVIRNLCLSVENHDLLLDPKINLITRIALPLAGPEEFSDEETARLPLELQYLPVDKTREPEASIRKMILDIIMQLCTTSSAREVLRESGVYLILREYYEWEKNPEYKDFCLDLINILIRKEEEIGVDNLRNVDIPSNLIEVFNEHQNELKKLNEKEEVISVGNLRNVDVSSNWIK